MSSPEPPMPAAEFGPLLISLVNHVTAISAMPLETMVGVVDWHLDHPDHAVQIPADVVEAASGFARIISAAIHLRDTVNKEIVG